MSQAPASTHGQPPPSSSSAIAARIFEAAPVALVHFDATLCVLRANRAATPLFGEPAAIEGQLFAQLRGDELDEAVLRHGLVEETAPVTLRLGDGEALRYFEVICTPLLDEGGKPGVLLTGLDVTVREQENAQRRALEQELTYSRDELQAILDNLSEGVWLIEPDGSQRYRNPAGRRLLGISDDAPDFVVTDFASLKARYADGSAMQREELPRYRAARGEVVTGLEMYVTGQDGVERLLKVDTNALRDADGKVLLGFNLMRDITALRELELEYKARNAELETILENLTDAVWLVDRNGNTHYMNTICRELMGIGEEQQFKGISDFVGLQISTLDGSPIATPQYPLIRAMRGEKFDDEELRFIDLNGKEHLVSVSGVGIRDEQGLIRLGLNVARDITHQMQLEDELKTSRDELQAILENLADSVFIMDTDGNMTYINRAARELLGTEDGEVSKVNDFVPMNIRHADGRPMAVEEYPIVRAAKGENFSDAEVLVTGRDGTTHLLSLNCSSLRNSHGKVVMGIVVGRDISARHELELELQSSRDELQAILENMAEGVTLMDDDGRMRFTNRAGRMMLGRGLDTQGFERIEDYANLEVLYADGRPIPLKELPLNRALRGERFDDFEMIYTGIDGVQRRLSIGGSRIKAKDGRYVAINVYRDVTSQYEIEMQIAELLVQSDTERERLGNVIDQMPEGVLIIDPKGAMVAMNKKARRLLMQDEVIVGKGLNAYQFLDVRGPDGEPWPLEMRPIIRSLHGEVLIGVQMSVMQADGNTLDLLVNSTPLYERSSGTPVISGAISVFQDIGELKQLDRLKDDFISITSHELRTPLTTIKGYAQMMSRRLGRMDADNPARSELQKPLSTILERTERMITMVNDLLDVSRLATGRFEVVGHALDLSAIVVRCVEQARITSGLPIALEAQANAIAVTGDERLVEQVLNNLLGNAAKYSPDGGAITVRMQCDEAFATISVQDSGIGIPPEAQERLFERFYRSERGKNMAPGLGLGLYISHGIITAHGGKLWVESEGEGKGATFSFTLPLANKE